MNRAESLKARIADDQKNAHPNRDAQSVWSEELKSYLQKGLLHAKDGRGPREKAFYICIGSQEGISKEERRHQIGA